MPKPKCVHKRVTIRSISTYFFPNGYKNDVTEPQENGIDVDMAEFFIEENRDKIICEDCKEQRIFNNFRTMKKDKNKKCLICGKPSKEFVCCSIEHFKILFKILERRTK